MKGPAEPARELKLMFNRLGLSQIWRMAYVLLTVVALLWAGNSLVGRAAHESIPPFTLALVRWTGALLLVLPFAWRAFQNDLPVLRQYWKPTLLLGLIGIGAFNALLYSGLQYTSAINGVLIQALTPPLILLLAFAFFGERTSLVRSGAALISVVGVGVIVLRGNILSLATLSLGTGDGLILIGVLAWAVYSLFLRWRPPVHPLSFLVATFTIGVVAMLPLSMMEYLSGRTIRWNTGTLLAFGYVVTLPSLVAYLLYNRAIELIGATRAGQFLNLMPLFGAVLAILLLGEAPGMHHLIGGCLILLGILGFALIKD